MRWRTGSALVLVTLVLAGAACGDDADPVGSGGDVEASGDTPDACDVAPLTMSLEAFGEAPAGGPDFEVTDAVARRVPILPGAQVGEPEQLEARQDEAAETDLALFSLYLADFDIDRGTLESFGFANISPPAGGTIGTLTIVPPTEAGFASGDIARGEEIDYDATTTFATLGLTVLSGGTDGFGEATDDTVGEVEILYLDDDTICLDIDLALLYDGEVVYAAQGVVAAPIVRAPREFFFT